MKLRSKFEYEFKSADLKKPIDHRRKAINYHGGYWIHLLPHSLQTERMKTGLRLSSKHIYHSSPSRHIKNKYRKKLKYKKERKTIWDVACFEACLERNKKDECCIPESLMSTDRGSECDNKDNVVHTAAGGGESTSDSTMGLLPGPVDGVLSGKGMSIR